MSELPPATRNLLLAACIGLGAVLLIVSGLVVAGYAVDRVLR